MPKGSSWFISNKRKPYSGLAMRFLGMATVSVLGCDYRVEFNGK